MNKEIEKKSLSGTLRLRDSRAEESTLTQETLNTNGFPAKEDTIAPPSHALKSKPNFNAIYNQLHGKFPEIININKSVLLAVSIRKQMSKETGLSSVILKRWIAWYCRKSNYYAHHIEGFVRYNLDGTEAGIVTQKHQEKMNKFLEKIKSSKSNASDTDNNKSKDSDK
jgi:hypothetical protein